MKYSNQHSAHPLRLLLYLEWILFFITILGILRTPKIPPSLKIPLIFPQISYNYSPFLIVSAGAFMALGLRRPNRETWVNVLYIGTGFALIGLTGIANGTTINVSPAFLLVMVIRGCLNFKLSGSLIVAGISFSWFLISLSLAVQHSFDSLNIQQVPAIVTQGVEPKVIYQLYSDE